MKRIDLHTHSNISDGASSPEDVMRSAKEAGLCAVALTDHDTVAGLDRAEAEAKRLGIEFVPGVEVSSECISQVHVLGYYIDRTSPVLREAFDKMQEERIVNFNRCLKKLIDHGFYMTAEDVRAVAGDAGVGRAHFARVMVDKGYVSSVKEAFDRYLYVGGPCYVKRDVIDAKEAVALIHRAGGLAFFAHPHQTRLNNDGIYELMKELAAAGLDGVEGYYSEYTPEMGETIRNMAESLGLLLSGGSDYHAAMKPHIAIGSGIGGNLSVDYALLEKIKKKAAGV